MLLKLTYSTTKNFLKTTIHTFKSYFAGSYQKLPKTPPCNPFSCTGTRPTVAGIHREPDRPVTTITETLNLKETDIIKKQENKIHGKFEKNEERSSNCLVTRKLKELEMMDRNNVDLVLDIEEVLDYYSRLTCPVYKEIIEKFFVEMYSGTFVI